MKVLAISGPTCMGKTRLSLLLAKQLEKHKKISVVNFDSLLFYKELSIGTARPTLEEMQGIEHHLVGTQEITTPLNAADFCKQAEKIINKLIHENKCVLLVGGSGFYLQALLKGMAPTLPLAPEIQQKSDLLFRKEGIPPFLEILKENDLKSFNKLHQNDHYRIRRAVEYYWANSRPFSESIDSISSPPPWSILHFHLDMPREEHWPYIKKRTQDMIDKGLIEECQNLIKQNLQGCRPAQSIGYKETFEYLQNPDQGLEHLKERISISTRQLAKAQRTWFKKVQNKTSFHPISQQESFLSLGCKFFLED